MMRSELTFSQLTPVSRFYPLKPKTLWTLVGVCAIPLWAVWPLLAVLSTQTPVFEFMTVIFTVAAVLLWALPKSATSRHLTRGRLPLLPAIMAAIGIWVSNMLFLLSIHYIPAAQANLIVYLWPLMVVMLGLLFGLFAARPLHAASIFLGLVGAGFVIGTSGIEFEWRGIALAAASGICWAVYVIFRMRQSSGASDALMPGFALSALLSLILHLSLETTTAPSSLSLLCMLLIGLVPLGLGNVAWDYGIRLGNRALLAVLAYATPLVSALILVAAGHASLTAGLLIGGVMIVSAGILSTHS